jgi:hypothetical protein
MGYMSCPHQSLGVSNNQFSWDYASLGAEIFSFNLSMSVDCAGYMIVDAISALGEGFCLRFATEVNGDNAPRFGNNGFAY